jgi:hypothetical protein
MSLSVNEPLNNLFKGCRVCGNLEQYANLFYNINQILLKNLISLLQSDHTVRRKNQNYFKDLKSTFKFLSSLKLTDPTSVETALKKLKVSSDLGRNMKKHPKILV